MNQDTNPYQPGTLPTSSSAAWPRRWTAMLLAISILSFGAGGAIGWFSGYSVGWSDCNRFALQEINERR